MRDDLRRKSRRHAEQIAEARERAEPALEFHARWLRKLIQPKLRADARALEEHGERADDAAVADVLRGLAPAIFCERREELQVSAQALRGRVHARVPEGLFATPTAAQIHDHEQVIARLRVETREQVRRFPECRGSEESGAAFCESRVAADDRHAVSERRRAHAAPDLLRAFCARRPEHIHDRQRSPAHRGDVAQIHHHRRIAGEPRIIRHKGFQHAFCREKQPVVAVRNRRAIVAERDAYRDGLRGCVGGVDCDLLRDCGASREERDEPRERRCVVIHVWGRMQRRVSSRAKSRDLGAEWTGGIFPDSRGPSTARRSAFARRRFARDDVLSLAGPIRR